MDIKPLKRAMTTALFYMSDTTRIEGPHESLRGDCTGLRGDCSRLQGDCSGLWGDCSGLRGNLNDIPIAARFQHSHIQYWVDN